MTTHKNFPLNDWLPFLGPEKAIILFKVFILSQKKGFCYASQSTLAHQCGINLRTFKRLLKELRSEHFFKFHEKPVLRKPLKLSLTDKAFYPKAGDTTTPDEQLLVTTGHQTGDTTSLNLVTPCPSNNKITGEPTGLKPAYAGSPGAEKPPHTQEQLLDSSYRFDGLQPEASEKLCHAFQGINAEYDVKYSRMAWHLWLKENPKGFASCAKTYFDEKDLQKIVAVLQTFLHKDQPSEFISNRSYM